MPKGYPLSEELKKEILARLKNGDSRSALARDYQLHKKTVDKLVYDAVKVRREQLIREGRNYEETEREVDDEFRGATVRSFEYPWKIKDQFLL